MIRIRIRNFGPIKGGYQENDGWLDVTKVTVFIGNQGSGKSTVAKLISSFMWLEKAVIRGDVQTPVSNKRLIELLEFHRLQNYLQADSVIEYEGTSLDLSLEGKQLGKQTVVVKKKNSKTIRLPKIMYVPAERNFLSSIENINKVSNLIVGSLHNYSIEFRNAQLEHLEHKGLEPPKGKSVDLPINNTKVVYDPKEDENYLLIGTKRLKLTEASSGFHSIVPLFWVTKYLAEFVKYGEKSLLSLLSPDQAVRRNNELKELNLSGLDEKSIRSREKKINEKYVCKYFVNIVEEPEQNLFPTSQRLLLNSLLKFNNGNNMLIMTTHSPYLINYLTLAVKADMVKKAISEEAKEKLNAIVPVGSTVKAEDLRIYELDESKGSIARLEDYKGLPSDENYLNSGLEASNELFVQLQEIEKGWR